jgi:pentatricopeptide repeat protein
MLGMGVVPNVSSYDIIIGCVTQEKNLEMALALLTDMESRGLSPTSETAEYIIVLAARLGHPRLAIDLATSYETGSVRPLGNLAWVDCLAASAEYLYVRLAHSTCYGTNAVFRLKELTFAGIKWYTISV